MKIDKHVPLPKPQRVTRRKATDFHKGVQTLLLECDEGDSFLLEGNLRSLRCSVGKLARSLNLNVVLRPEGDKVRVWRK